MGQFLLDASVNVYEVFAFTALMLSIFRISLKEYLVFTIIAGVVIALTSYLLRFVFNLETITPLFMLLWLFIFVWQIFRFHSFYALMMTVTGYLGYLVIQCLIILLLQIRFSLEEISTPLLHAKLLQLVSATVTLVIAYWLWKKRLGFSFVPDRMSEKVEMKGLNLVLLSISIVACFFISGIAYLFIDVSFWFNTVVIILLLCLITVSMMLKFALDKEMKS
jgi:hypothetical protein